MKWDSTVHIACICTAYLMSCWLIVCILNVWEVLGGDIEVQDVVAVASGIAFLIAVMIAVITMHSPSTQYRRELKHLVIAMMLAAVIIAVSLVIWMPFCSYSWEIVTVITAVIVLASILFIIASGTIHRTWYYTFLSSHKKQAFVTKRTREVGYSDSDREYVRRESYTNAVTL